MSLVLDPFVMKFRANRIVLACASSRNCASRLVFPDFLRADSASPKCEIRERSWRWTRLRWAETSAVYTLESLTSIQAQRARTPDRSAISWKLEKIVTFVGCYQFWDKFKLWVMFILYNLSCRCRSEKNLNLTWRNRTAESTLVHFVLLYVYFFFTIWIF